jgi:hypothetical protein
MPITAAARSKARTVFARSNAGVVGSNIIRGMDVCVHLICVCDVMLCRQQPCDGLIPRPGSPTDCVYRITKLKKRQGPNKGLYVTDE